MLLRLVPRAFLCLLVLVFAGACSSHTTTTSTTTVAPSSTSTVRESALPAEARATLALIDKGGPYPYSRDGIVFGNFEGLLPKEKRGYYHEYTVKTPGSRDRGARRIIAGQGGEFYYTDDHYGSFRKVLR